MLHGSVIRTLTQAALVPDRPFLLARVNLVRAGCPLEIRASFENVTPQMPVVIVKNRRRYGYVRATDYAPRAIVAAGAAKREQLLEKSIWAYAWVEDGAMDLKNEDTVTPSVLMRGLARTLLASHLAPEHSNPLPGQVLPFISRIYPFEGYIIANKRGREYRQDYELDAESRSWHLKGDLAACSDVFTMPRVQTGARWTPGSVPPDLGQGTTGAGNSELVTQVIRDMTNINGAVLAYLTAIKNGTFKPLQPSFYPVPLTSDGKIQKALTAVGIDPLSFAVWSVIAQKKTAKVGTGERVKKSNFAYTPTDNPSDWKLPIHDSSHQRNALARLNQVQGIPADKKPGILRKIRNKAKKSGVEVSEKPTPGQKKWTGKKVTAEAIAVSKNEFVKEHKRLVNVLRRGSQVEEQEEARRQAREVAGIQ